MSIISIVTAQRGKRAGEQEPAGQDQSRRGAAAIRIRRGQLRAGPGRSRARVAVRPREADPEEAEVLAWCRVQVRQMLRDGWTPAELAQVGVSETFLWRLGLTPDGAPRGYGSRPSGGTAAVSQTPLSLR